MFTAEESVKKKCCRPQDQIYVLTAWSMMNLFVEVLYFNSYDLSISPLPNTDIGRADRNSNLPCVSMGGNLIMGFGPESKYNPLRFKIANGLDRDIGYLKIYLSTQPLNLAYLPQPSPFAFKAPSTLKPCNCKPAVSWTNIVVPIILHRNIDSYYEARFQRPS
ncbi:hypothetical protein BDN70DRAFT_74568 [Pholiota conissans]|uniref:Uncharacterized protein n=1 Tax=Pholiota conissans TaxID=109636 RepID=A0A9P5YYS0_9AGAR|nr:hypothetical protein BDN70DRAFT_74568 [Pholiota conissans]